MFANIEDKNEIVVIDAKDALVSKRYSIAPCDGPSGLTIDPKGRLYSVCENKMMIVSDPAAGKVLATPAIGAGRMAWRSTTAMRSARTARDGTITMVGETSPGKFESSRPSPRSAARAPSAQIRKRTSCICRRLKSEWGRTRTARKGRQAGAG